MPTIFQNSVYKALHKIPKGKVTTYGAIAKYLKSKAFQAVGTALSKNPNAPKCPCHRVVPINGNIGNYSGPGGIDTKIKLLQEEGITIKNGKIVNFKKLFYSFPIVPLN